MTFYRLSDIYVYYIIWTYIYIWYMRCIYNMYIFILYIMYISYVYIICIYYMYILYVYIICIYYMYILYVYIIFSILQYSIWPLSGILPVIFWRTVFPEVLCDWHYILMYYLTFYLTSYLSLTCYLIHILAFYLSFYLAFYYMTLYLTSNMTFYLTFSLVYILAFDLMFPTIELIFGEHWKSKVKSCGWRPHVPHKWKNCQVRNEECPLCPLVFLGILNWLKKTIFYSTRYIDVYSIRLFWSPTNHRFTTSPYFGWVKPRWRWKIASNHETGGSVDGMDKMFLIFSRCPTFRPFLGVALWFNQKNRLAEATCSSLPAMSTLHISWILPRNWGYHGGSCGVLQWKGMV